MKYAHILLAAIVLLLSCRSGSEGGTMADTSLDKAKLRTQLSDAEYSVICENGTEPPFKNEYWDNHREGIYVDKISGKPLFSSKDKFDSGTGWPSFSALIEKSSVKEVRDDSYGMVRTEVRSASSDAHLGHLFDDGPTPSGLRYCINSASLQFIPKEELSVKGYGKYLALFDDPASFEVITLAGGCFWGVEEYYSRVSGVVDAVSGYAGGTTKNPTYKEVCTGLTGHAESVKITFDPKVVTLSEILARFWGIHNPTILNRQGNDVGSQYRSAIFYSTDSQKVVIDHSIHDLVVSGKYGSRKIVTEVAKLKAFYPAEEYHQDYLKKNPGGYCHIDLSGAEKNIRRISDIVPVE